MSTQRRFSIVFVCTGNICRSPMAKGILEDLLSAKALSMTDIGSAGTGAIAGLPASENSVVVCGEEGIDISSLRSRPLSRDLVEESDLILTMEEHHLDAARRLAPEQADRIHLLARYAADDDTAPVAGVADPIGGSLEDYRVAFVQIREQIHQALPRIEREILAGVVES